MDTLRDGLLEFMLISRRLRDTLKKYNRARSDEGALVGDTQMQLDCRDGRSSPHAHISILGLDNPPTYLYIIYF